MSCDYVVDMSVSGFEMCMKYLCQLMCLCSFVTGSSSQTMPDF